jgi:hypothetical protein
MSIDVSFLGGYFSNFVLLVKEGLDNFLPETVFVVKFDFCDVSDFNLFRIINNEFIIKKRAIICFFISNMFATRNY